MLSTFIRDARAGSPAVQQSACRVLGVLDYSAYRHGITPAIEFLIESVDRPVRHIALIWRKIR